MTTPYPKHRRTLTVSEQGMNGDPHTKATGRHAAQPGAHAAEPMRGLLYDVTVGARNEVRAAGL